MRAAIRQILFAETPISPIRLFGAGEQGVWYDPSDLSTLFKLSTDTTPNVGVGDPVGKILDKSGRGNHATQTTLTARPTLQQDAGGNYYLKFDGTDDCLFTGAIDFSATSTMTVFAGVTKLTNTTGIICELSATIATNNGSFTLLTDISPDSYRFVVKGVESVDSTRATYTAPTTNVLTGIGDIKYISNTFRINQSSVTVLDAPQAVNFGNYPLFIGRRNNVSFPFNGSLYSLIIRGVQSTTVQIAKTEVWVNRKTGAY